MFVVYLRCRHGRRQFVDAVIRLPISKFYYVHGGCPAYFGNNDGDVMA